MQRPLFLTLSAFLALGNSLSAQDIPSEVIGDTGWFLFGADTMIAVRAADGHVWLQQNLGAEGVAAEHNDPNAFGDLYQWGRWFDGHGIRTSLTAQASLLSQNNPIGLGMGNDSMYIGPNPSDWWGAGTATDTWQGNVASATNGVDPCIALGTAWHLPSQADWTDVLTAESITDMATAFTSNLKLSAGGARDGQSGIIINAGIYGQYWSSTASGVYAKDLTVGDTVNADDDAYRSYGMSMRCLNKSLHVGIGPQEREGRGGLFPNPSNGTFTVDLGATLIEGVEAYTADARVVRTWVLRQARPLLSLDDMPSGTYLIKLVSTEGIQWTTLTIER